MEDFKAHKSNYKYYQRLNLLDNVIKNMPNAQAVHTEAVSSLEEAYKVYTKFTSEGKEGSVLKTTDFLWRDGTSKNCIKLKLEFAVDLVVTDILEGEGKASGMVGSITLATSDGKLVTNCGSGFSDADRVDWWTNRIERVGSIVTVKANDVITKRGSNVSSLFLPIFLDHRLDKTEADSLERVMEQLEAAKNGG